MTGILLQPFTSGRVLFGHANNFVVRRVEHRFQLAAIVAVARSQHPNANLGECGRRGARAPAAAEY